MKKNYDFSGGKRGAIVNVGLKNKTLISIRLDPNIINWFKNQVELAGGGNYQTLINQAMQDYINQQQEEPLEKLLRRIIKEELHDQSAA